MKKTDRALLGLAVLAVFGGLVPGMRTLDAQVVRCWDVVCTVSTSGTMSCIETPKPCPTEVT